MSSCVTYQQVLPLRYQQVLRLRICEYKICIIYQLFMLGHLLICFSLNATWKTKVSFLHSKHSVKP